MTSNYYQNDKQLLSKPQREAPKKAREKYQNISEEEKKTKCKKRLEKFN